MLRKAIPLIALGVAAVLGVVAFFVIADNISHSFQTCISHEKDKWTQRHPQQERGIIGGRVESRVVCAIRLVDAHNGLFSAALAFLTAFITVGLVWMAFRQERTTRRQLRAYVLPETAGIYEGTTLSPPVPAHANEPGVVVSFKNSGQTPAYQYVSWAQIGVEELANAHTLVAPTLKIVFPATIGSNAVTTKAVWFGRALTAPEIADIVVGKKFIFVYGRCEYRDTFNHYHWTNFRLQYAGPFPPVPNAILNFSETGNNSD